MSRTTGAPVTDRSLPDVAPLFAGWWPEPGPARRGFVVAAGGVGLLAALLIPGAPRPGINLFICALAAALPVATVSYQLGRRRGRRWSVGRVPIALGVVAIGLAGICVVRASEWLAVGSLVAAFCLAAAISLDVRRGPAVLLTVPLFGVAVLRALPWARSAVPAGGLPKLPRPWVTGIAIGTGCTVAVAALLASADAAFSDLLGTVFGAWPSIDLALFPARALVFLAAAGTVLGALFAVSTQFAPRTALTRWVRPAPTEAARHPAEWLIPLVLVAVTIAAFLAVEATQLFGGADVVLEGTVTPAERAREGFGQLTVVTLIVLGLLAWAGHVTATGPAAHRRLLGGVGGVLVVLALLLGGSALRRLWLYQDEFGWTVTRLNAGAFEIWVATVLIGIALGWLLRRSDLLPRFLIGSAALGLLVVGMAGPDALVAQANVDRFKHDQEIDLYYLSELSDDAIPAIYRLPASERAWVLARRTPTDDPWFGWNLSRWRADQRAAAESPGG